MKTQIGNSRLCRRKAKTETETETETETSGQSSEGEQVAGQEGENESNADEAEARGRAGSGGALYAVHTRSLWLVAALYCQQHGHHPHVHDTMFVFVIHCVNNTVL